MKKSMRNNRKNLLSKEKKNLANTSKEYKQAWNLIKIFQKQ